MKSPDLSNETKLLKSFVNDFSSIINDVGNNFLIRHNENNDTKFNFKNTLYASTKILNNKSIDYVINELEIDNIVSASKNALVKIRNEDKTHKFIKNTNDRLLDLIYSETNSFIGKYKFKLSAEKTCYIETDEPDMKLYINNTDKRFLGCDGMQLNLCKGAINNDTILPSQNGNYGVMIISGLFDVINKIPINYYPIHLVNKGKKKVNETLGFLQQADKLSNDDVVIFDRLYFSKDFHKKLINKNIGYIFRAMNNSNHFSDILLNGSKIKKINGVNVQLFKYKIKDEFYNIITSITENISINEIKALYWRRWKIETDNKKFKYDILGKNIRSKNTNSISTDIESIRFMSILSSIIEYLGKNKRKKNTKINMCNCIDILYKKLLYFLLYDNDNIKEICRIIGIIYKTLVSLIEGRNCERIRLSPSTKWSKDGNRNNNG